MINGRSVYRKMSKGDRQAVKDLQAEINTNETGKLFHALTGGKVTVYDVVVMVTPEV